MPATETPIGGPGWSLGSNSGSADASLSRGPITTNATDEQLARAAGRGDTAAFEALYERHHLALLSFARHMLGGVHDAEDVVQHTFLAADRDFRAGKVPRAVRAWLYTVARNRCVSLLRARHEAPGLPDAAMPSTENLAADVEQREDLRNLLADVRELPDDQRAALLLTELGDLSHAEVANVIGVRPGKVKALMFQARETLMAAASARAIPCRSIQEELSVATGSALRRRHLRNHLAQCPGCREYADRVRAQRASLALILPVVPTVALRDSVLSGLAGSAAAGAGAGATAGGVGLLAAKSTAAKLLAIAAVGGAAAGGGTVAITAHDTADRPRAAESREQRAPSVPATPAATPLAPAANGGERSAADRIETRSRRQDASAGRARRERARGERRGAPATVPRGNANGRRDEPGAAQKTPPGQAKPKPAPAKPKDAPAKLKPAQASKPKPHKVATIKPKLVKPPRAERATPAAPEPPGQAQKQAKDAAAEQPAAEPVTGG